MVNDLKALMRDNVAEPPPDHLDPLALVGAGRRRVRRRRTTIAGGTAAVVAGAVLVTAFAWPHGTDQARSADRPPAPDAPTIRLQDATAAVAGRDYEVLTSYTNQNLDRDNGQYLDGVTDDGLVLFRDGPRSGQLRPRFALMDPATGAKDWLPDLRIGQTQTWPVELGADRLVLLALRGPGQGLVAYVFDRGERQWRTMAWPSLPDVDFPTADVGPDGRLYVSVPATRGRVPEGGWPTSADGDAEDADAEGDTFALWSVSLDDGSDARDEGLSVGSLAFTDTSMVWTDSTNGAAGMVHVRDLSTGEETAFDPHTGERCNLLSFGATDDRVVMSQYCGTYGDDVRDDRVQVLTTDGEQVVTLQDSGVEGSLAGAGGTGDVVTVVSYDRTDGGTYVYDLGTGSFLRLSDAVSSFGLGGPTPDGRFLWHTPVNRRHGATQWLGRLVSPQR